MLGEGERRPRLRAARVSSSSSSSSSSLSSSPSPHPRHPELRQWRNNVAFGGNKFKLLPSRVSRNETEVRRRGSPAATRHLTLFLRFNLLSLSHARLHARLRFVIRSRSNDDFSRLSTRRKPVSRRVGWSVGRLGILKYVRQVKRHMTVHTCEPKDEYHILYCIYIYTAMRGMAMIGIYIGL